MKHLKDNSGIAFPKKIDLGWLHDYEDQKCRGCGKEVPTEESAKREQQKVLSQTKSKEEV